MCLLVFARKVLKSDICIELVVLTICGAVRANDIFPIVVDQESLVLVVLYLMVDLRLH